MTSALPLAVPACIKYWEIAARASVSVSVGGRESSSLRLRDREKATQNIKTVFVSANLCVFMTGEVSVCVCVFVLYSRHAQCHYELRYLKKMDVTECVALWLGYRDMTVCLSSKPVYCCLCIMILFTWIFLCCFQRLGAVFYVLPQSLTCTHCVFPVCL